MGYIPEDVKSIFEWIQLCNGVIFSEEDVVAVVKTIAEKGQRKLIVEETPIQSGLSGYTFLLKDVIYVCINSNIDPVRRCGTRLHEYSHIMLNHVAPLPYTYDDFLQARYLHGKQLRHEPITAYDEPVEYAAETLAMLLLEVITKFNESIPTTVIDMYGYDKDW